MEDLEDGGDVGVAEIRVVSMSRSLRPRVLWKLRFYVAHATRIHLNGHVCMPNICSCENGRPATGISVPWTVVKPARPAMLVLSFC